MTAIPPQLNEAASRTLGASSSWCECLLFLAPSGGWGEGGGNAGKKTDDTKPVASGLSVLGSSGVRVLLCLCFCQCGKSHHTLKNRRKLEIVRLLIDRLKHCVSIWWAPLQ